MRAHRRFKNEQAHRHPRVVGARPRVRSTGRLGVIGLSAVLLLGIGSSCGDYLAGGPAPSILSVMEGVEKAPHETAFLGTRRVKIHQSWEGGLVNLEFTEEVAADGQGQFAIHTQDVVNSNGLDPFLFQQIQDSRAGFFWRYRDFSIKTWDNFAGNWQVHGLGSMTSVAGRQAWQLDIERKLGQKTYYRIAVDIETGLVLRCVELAAHGNSGVRLVAEGSPVLAELMMLEERGVDVIPCRTCLAHYEVEPQVGEVSDMDTIVRSSRDVSFVAIATIFYVCRLKRLLRSIVAC